MRLKAKVWWSAAVVLFLIFGLTAAVLEVRQTEEIRRAQVLGALTPALTTVEIADTPETLTLGLSGRSPIPDDYGMLFVFPREGRYGFWMKDMKEGIDIIWLNDDGTIMGIEHGVSPATYPAVFYPPAPVQKVLETRAGLAQSRGWQAGQYLPLPTKDK